MSLQEDYNMQVNAIRAGFVGDDDPNKCTCHGGGWILTSFDTWEPCPYHPGRRHPEDYDWAEDFDNEEFDREYTNYVATSLWEDRYPDYSDEYYDEEDDIPF